MTEGAAPLVERILRFATPRGDVEHRGTSLRQTGEMRFAPDRPWLPFVAEQTFAARRIDFRWTARVRMVPLVHARVIDSFDGGVGSLEARVFGIVPVAFARGPQTDKGEALRGLAELPWRPFAFAGGMGLAFEAVSEDRLRASFDDGRTQATLDFQVSADGAILEARAASRPRVAGKEVVHNAWSGTFGDYRELDGVRVPTTAEVTWHLPEGPFTYFRGRVTEFKLIR